MTIPGIVNVTAERIMVHRECFILYQSVQDNIGVRGIGTKTFEKLNRLLIQRVDIHV